MKKRTSRIAMAALSCLLAVFTSACSLIPGKDNASNPATPSISSTVDVNENYYSGLFPYKENKTRGMLSKLKSYRIDFSHLELGLMEIARETYKEDDYYFQEGQVIPANQVKAWLSSPSEDPAGLNPEKGGNLLVNVLEHDYLDKNSKKLSGIVLGLTLSPRYKDASGQDKMYSTDELRTKGEQLASHIVTKVHTLAPQIPMVVALYQVPDKSSTLVPGHFILTGTVNANESSVSKWQPIDEAYYLFPSDDVYKAYPQISLQYDKLMKQTQSFFGEYIGLTGVGRFMDGQLIEMNLTATAEYDSRTEVLQFTQYAATLIDQLFDKKVQVNLYVQSVNKPLAIYIRPANGEGYMHIYRQ
ncbi:CamS family sex pheromone protein [Brevibacillus ginsengisoli]|uniref:CamS family sex pheromone protein n=1 Tax=Brevibacillus ginsengisoli TaxID=363854 RepID=UPI003CECE58D